MRKFEDGAARVTLRDQARTLEACLVAPDAEPDLRAVAELLVPTGARVERLV